MLFECVIAVEFPSRWQLEGNDVIASTLHRLAHGVSLIYENCETTETDTA